MGHLNTPHRRASPHSNHTSQLCPQLHHHLAINHHVPPLPGPSPAQKAKPIPPGNISKVHICIPKIEVNLFPDVRPDSERAVGPMHPPPNFRPLIPNVPPQCFHPFLFKMSFIT